MSNNQEKRKLSIFVYAFIAVMAVVFVVRLFVPADFGEVFAGISIDAESVIVTVSDTKNGAASYATYDKKDIEELGNWLDGKKLSYATLGDTFTNNSVKTKYVFSIVSSAGKYSGMTIDDQGYVKINTTVYKIRGNVDEFIKELVNKMDGWHYEG